MVISSLSSWSISLSLAHKSRVPRSHSQAKCNGLHRSCAWHVERPLSFTTVHPMCWGRYIPVKTPVTRWQLLGEVEMLSLWSVKTSFNMTCVLSCQQHIRVFSGSLPAGIKLYIKWTCQSCWSLCSIREYYYMWVTYFLTVPCLSLWALPKQSTTQYLADFICHVKNLQPGPGAALCIESGCWSRAWLGNADHCLMIGLGVPGFAS